jgi:hypothetical protein
MEYQIAWQDVTYISSLNSFMPTGSSVEIDTVEELNILFASLMNQRFKRLILYRSLIPLFEIDLSSVRPRFDMKSETFETGVKEISEDMIVAEMLKYDIVIHLPPVREYPIKIKVERVEKATPRVVEPEGI